jgi:hypothetical protein
VVYADSRSSISIPSKRIRSRRRGLARFLASGVTPHVSDEDVYVGSSKPPSGRSGVFQVDRELSSSLTRLSGRDNATLLRHLLSTAGTPSCLAHGYDCIFASTSQPYNKLHEVVVHACSGQFTGDFMASFNGPRCISRPIERYIFGICSVSYMESA